MELVEICRIVDHFTNLTERNFALVVTLVVAVTTSRARRQLV